MRDTVTSENDTVVPPSSLFVFWPGNEPPVCEEIRLRLAEFGQPAPDADGCLEPEETLWSYWLDLADRPLSYLLWCECALGEHLSMLDETDWGTAAERRRAQSCRWVVGLEGPISLRHPSADYQFQLRLCDAISRDWAPVVFDASACRFRSARQLRHLIEPRTPPRNASLYGIHKVRSNDPDAAEARFWIHTHGLERAAVPDLELFDVPAGLVRAACELIEAVADLWIEFKTPPPQVPFAVGRNLEVAWRPWQAVASERHPQSAGGWHCRQPEHGHTGFRVVLVAPRPEGWLRPRWNAPFALLERLTEARTTLYKTTTETRRMASLARERWGTFGLLFASQHPADWRFCVKLCFPLPENPLSGEHLWFDVEKIKAGRVRARLVSTPSSSDRPLAVGNVRWFALERLTDWRIVTPQGPFGPETADQLLELDLSA